MVQLVSTTKKKVSLYLTEELKAEAEALAKAEKRSLNNLIEVLLEDAVSKFRKRGDRTH